MKENIVLIGFMGCGKTSVGGKLSRAFHCNFLDTDQLLEEEFGCTIREFFEREGEGEFRKRETELIGRLSSTLENTVLATGGGLPLRPENVGILKAIGVVFWLKASEEMTMERLCGDTSRPLLAQGDLKEKVHHLLGRRMPLYEAAADHIIETDGKSFYEIIKEIENVMRCSTNETSKERGKVL